MNFPPKIVDKPSTHSIGRQGQPIRFIVVHDTERSNNDSNSIEYLVKNNRQVSIHLLIELDGTAYRMVPDNKGANHCGYSAVIISGVHYSRYAQFNCNVVSLGIELEKTKGNNDPYPEDQLLTMGWQICTWRDLHGPLPIFRHGSIDTQGKTDPRGLTVADIEYWSEKARQIMNNNPTVDNPIDYRVIVPQVVYTDRKLSSAFAGGQTPMVLETDAIVAIGDITGDWGWIKQYRSVIEPGFVPIRTLEKTK
jgi:hypothetical protein